MSNELHIDIAVLYQELTPIDVILNNSNITELDEIHIEEDIFKRIFYAHGETFGLDPSLKNSKEYYPYITFLTPYRKVNNKLFVLLEQIFKNIENDLNLSRNCFTTTSCVELTNEILNIKTLCDLRCCSVLNSLTWENIEQLNKNYKLSHTDNEKNDLILVISVILKTPTEGVKNTIIKFKYRIKSV
uniref:Uncharacterized protein n=1 Tax=viral metagenome TaxID=1070528 RepID=A0A6C0BCB7_9ZZZZ